MACIVRDPGGHKRVQFVAPCGQRRTVRLGKVEVRHAEAVRIRVERLVSAAVTRQPLDADTAQWVADLDDVLYARMVAVGLLKARQARTLGVWLQSFMDSRKALKPESLRKLEQTRAKLLEHFGAGKSIHDITADEAALWREGLLEDGLSEATTKTHTGNAKTMFHAAVERELLIRSPFAKLQSGVTPTSNTRYVTPEETEKLLAAAPDSEWRLLLGLARLAGLRTPSETHLLTWSCIDWVTGRLTVASPKTERYAGHEKRVVPIGPRLMELLHERFADVPEGEERLVAIKGAGGRRRKMVAIMDDAGVARWDDAWQTLRRSCEIEWAQSFPQYVVSIWIGHSITVSGKHYANHVPDALFDRAAGHQATLNPTLHAAEPGRTEPHAAIP